MNPESVKVYARLGVEEYCAWMDKIMTVRHIDATRTTNLPCMEAADALEGWHEQLERPMEPEAPTEPPRRPSATAHVSPSTGPR